MLVLVLVIRGKARVSSASGTAWNATNNTWRGVRAKSETHLVSSPPFNSRNLQSTSTQPCHAKKRMRIFSMRIFFASGCFLLSFYRVNLDLDLVLDRSGG